MGHGTFAENALEALLSWFESLINGAWSLFTGASGGSLLRWLASNWLSLLIIFMIIGVAMDILVYLFRWRPFWWWFRKKRMIVDDRFLSRERKPARRVEPSTRIPKRIIRDDVEDEESENSEMFMDTTLFDVKPPKKASDSLYEVGPRTKNIRKNPSAHQD